MKAIIRHLIDPATLLELFCVVVLITCTGLIVIGVGGGRPSDRMAREVPAQFIEARR